MPVYEYQCKECGRVEEALQKISDPPLQECPSCKGGMKKLISQSTFHLKGSGWYVTDYGGSSNSAAPEGSDKPETSSSSEGTACGTKDKASASAPKTTDESK